MAGAVAEAGAAEEAAEDVGPLIVGKFTTRGSKSPVGSLNLKWLRKGKSRRSPLASQGSQSKSPFYCTIQHDGRTHLAGCEHHFWHRAHHCRVALAKRSTRVSVDCELARARGCTARRISRKG